MDAQPDTLPRDPINELYDAALDLRRAFPPSHYDDGRPRSAALLPHLRRAAYLRGRLQRAELAGYLSDAVLASSMTIAFVVDRDLSVLHSSGGADTLLPAAAPLRCHRGRLIADTHDGMPALATLVAQALRGETPPDVALQSRGQPGDALAPRIVSVAPLATPNGPLAVVFVRHPATATATAALTLRQRFDLTPSEAAVAQALAAGGSLAQIAQSHHISVNTVKTHIHHIYRKTATSRQAELVALLHGAGGLPPTNPAREKSPPPHSSG